MKADKPKKRKSCFFFILKWLVIFLLIGQAYVLLKDPARTFPPGPGFHPQYMRNGWLPMPAWDWETPGWSDFSVANQAHYVYKCMIWPFEKYTVYDWDSRGTMLWGWNYSDDYWRDDVYYVGTSATCQGRAIIRYYSKKY